MGKYKQTKKSTKSLVSVIFVMLVLLEICSATVLFSRITSFVGSKSRHYIALDSETKGTEFWTELKEIGDRDTLLAAEKETAEAPRFARTAFAPETGNIDFAYLFTTGSGKPQHEFGVHGEDDLVWLTKTNIELFKCEYENDEGKVTVLSDDGKTKVIAPGTSNSYTFTLKNTGICTLDYKVSVEAVVSGTDQRIPIEAKLKNFEGKYVVGGPDEWVGIDEIGTASDAGYLSSDRIADYIFEWQWPFESGDDAYDTMLGDMASSKEMAVTIIINTYAECNNDHDTPGGEDDPVSPATGDDFVLWLGILIIALILMILVIIIDKKRREEDEEEENDGKIAGQG